MVLTTAQCNAINTAQITHDYSAEAVDSFNATGDDKMRELQARFEASISYLVADDAGGIVNYFVDDVLVAYYDYENFVGATL